MDISRALGGFVKFITTRAPWLSSSESNGSQIPDGNLYRGIDPRMLQLKTVRNGRCLLSLDGGGIRGFSQLLILEELANRIMHDLGLQESPPLCDCFDMIGGVGTGGYLAILAGRLGLTVPQLKEEFRQLIACILVGSITSDELDDFFKAVVKRYTGDPDTPMLDPKSPTSHCKTFVGAITSGNVSYLTIFRSYDSQNQPIDIPIWQAARATLAHPDLFPATRVGSSDFEQVYISGEIGWKNPSNEVIREFGLLWPSQNIACLASIGSGHEGVIQIHGSSASDSITGIMKRMATNCEKVAEDIAYRFQDRKTYFRLNVEQGLQQNVLHQPLTLSDINSLTRSYLRSADANEGLNSLVASLLHAIEVSAWTTTRDHFKISLDEYITDYTKFVDDIGVVTVKSAAQEAVLLLKTIRGIRYSEDRWLGFAKMIANHFHSMNRRSIIELQEPLSSKVVWVSIKNYFGEISLVHKNLEQLLKINPHRVWGPPTHETFLAQAVTNLDECFKRIQSAVLNDVHDHTVSAKRDARLDDFISWISQLDMTKRHHDVLSKRALGTGSWFIDTSEFKTWLDGRGLEGCRALFGFGDPGAGKTFTCCSAIEYLRAFLNLRRAALLYIYCDYQDKDKQNTCNMIGELAKQLLLQSSTVGHDVWSLFERHTALSTEKAKEIFCLLARNFDSIYVCLDALDECKPQSRVDLLRFLVNLKGTALRIFCTGRSNVAANVTELIEPLGLKTIEIYAHEADIRFYLKETISQDHNKGAMDEQLEEEITRKLVSHKLFILVALQLRSILQHVTKRTRRQALNTVPTEIFELYDATFTRIRQQPIVLVDMATLILTWVYLAWIKLPVVVLQHALAVQTGDTAFDEDGIPSEDALLDCCLGLVIIEPETSTIRLIHSTLQEYLDDNWQELFPSGHSVIASTCITYLNFDHPLKREYELSTLLYYAAKYAGYHLRVADDPELDHQVLELTANKTNLRLLNKASYILYSGDIDDQLSSPLHWAAHLGVLSIAKLLLERMDNSLINARDGYGRTAFSFAAQFGHEEVIGLLLEREGVEVDSRDEDGRTPLSYAAESGHETVAGLLLSIEGVKANSRDKRGYTPLSYAALKGKEAVVKLLLGTEGVEANSRDADGYTPLSYAASHGHEAVIRLLLDTEGVEANLRDWFGRTPLSYSSQHGLESLVKLLLSMEDVEADSRDEIGYTPLLYAAKNGDEAIVRLLLDTEGVDVNLRDLHGCTPLSYAAKNGHEALVKLLLDTEGIEADLSDKDGCTPLSDAAIRGHEAVVKLLLHIGGAEVDSQDNNGRKPLSHAAQYGHEAVVNLLLDIGAEADSRDERGRTALSYAAMGGHEAVVKLLLGIEDVNVDSKDEDGRTPLSLAVCKNHEAVVKLLLGIESIKADSRDYGGRTPLSLSVGSNEAVSKLLLDTGSVEADSRDLNGRTPLSHAARGGYEAAVKLLLGTEGVEANSRDKDGRTPLLHAAKRGHKAVVRLLIHSSLVDVESQDNDLRTPLSWAAQCWGSNTSETVQLLLDHQNVDPDSKDVNGRTPLSYAAEWGRHGVIQLLLERNVNVNHKDAAGKTILSYAIYYASYDFDLLRPYEEDYRRIRQLLLDHGAIDTRNSDDSDA